MTSVAPSFFASSFFAAVPISANLEPECLGELDGEMPGPPMPRTATRSPGFRSAFRRPLITVYPAQKMGAAAASSSPAGTSVQPSAQASIRLGVAAAEVHQVCASGAIEAAPHLAEAAAAFAVLVPRHPDAIARAQTGHAGPERDDLPHRLVPHDLGKLEREERRDARARRCRTCRWRGCGSGPARSRLRIRDVFERPAACCAASGRRRA